MNWLSILWRGLLIGVADIIPGVSGGTIALLTGIYSRFIDALKQLTTIPALAWKVVTRKQTLKEAYTSLDWVFLLPLVFGILLALTLASYLIPSLMTEYPAPTFSFFILLILAASIGLLKAETHRLSSILAVLGGILLGISFGLLAPTTVSHGPIQLVIAGALAISAMLLPGISGSAVLLILGQYVFVLEALHAPLQNSTSLLSFVAGIAIGVICITRIISYLLDKARLHTISAMTGLMLGALIVPVQQALPHIPNQPIASVIFAIIGLLLGALLLRSHNQPVSEK
jgi:putative membrane protein